MIPPKPETLNPASIVLSTLKISPPLDSTSFKKSTISCSSESCIAFSENTSDSIAPA